MFILWINFETLLFRRWTVFLRLSDTLGSGHSLRSRFLEFEFEFEFGGLRTRVS